MPYRRHLSVPLAPPDEPATALRAIPHLRGCVALGAISLAAILHLVHAQSDLRMCKSGAFVRVQVRAYDRIKDWEEIVGCAAATH